MEIETSISDPLKLIDGLFVEKNEEREFAGSIFSELVSNEDYLNKLPLLNCTDIESIPAGHLVRMRGMVQDMFDPELYMDSVKIISRTSGASSQCFGRYRDHHTLKEGEEIDEESVVFGQRQSFYVVPIPGESSWAKELSLVVNVCRSQCNFIPKPTFKRSADMDIDNEIKRQKAMDEINKSANKMENPQPFDKHFPLSENDGCGCLLRVYDSMMDSLKLTDLIEVIGVFSPQIYAAGQNVIEGEEMGENCLKTLANNVPQIHSLVVHRLPHSNPLLPRNVFNQQIVDDCIGVNAEEIRDLLFAILIEFFQGDNLAASYTLLHLISVVGSHQSGSPKCHFPVNLSGCPSSIDLASHLSSLVSQLTPHCACIPLTRDSLCSSRLLMPVKDHSSGRLKPGLLQLQQGSQLVLDETGLTEGQLDNRGVLNLKSLLSVVAEQQLPYDFQFYTHNYNTDIRILIVSDTKSIVKGCTEIVWKPVNPPVAMGTTMVSLRLHLNEADKGNRIRRYLTSVPFCRARYQLPEDIQSRIHEDFVNLRKEDPEWLSVEEFTTMLNLVQLISLSHGRTEAIISDWESVVAMEIERKGRLKHS